MIVLNDKLNSHLALSKGLLHTIQNGSFLYIHVHVFASRHTGRTCFEVCVMGSHLYGTETETTHSKRRPLLVS